MSTTAIRMSALRCTYTGALPEPDAEARLAGGVGGGHRLRAAGRPDEVDARVVEQVLRHLERRVRDHLERVGRQTRRLACLLQDLGRARRRTVRRALTDA